MKGLLIKDGRLMITQGKTLLGIAVFMIVCSFLQGDSFPQFAASYSIMMTTIFTISTVSYDEYDNGIKYLLVLPVERRTYVKEKYCFGILMSCMVWGICSLIGIAGAFFQNADGLEEYLISSLSGMNLSGAVDLRCIQLYLDILVPMLSQLILLQI